MIPDLLEPTPRVRLDLARLERATDFAFASGGTYTEVDDCLDRAALAGSSWEPSCFEPAIFVRELVAASFPIVVDGARYEPAQKWLVEVLSRPPSASETTSFRQAILRELAENPAHRRDAERAYVRIRRVKELLGPKDNAELPDPARRRMDVLATVRELFEGLAAGFDGATSGLGRLRDFGLEVTGTPAFARVVDLLDLERHLATIDASVRIAADGTVRSVAIVAVRENTKNPLYVAPLVRLWRRLVKVVRGYAVRDEEVRDAVVDSVFAGIRREVAKLFQLQGDLEPYLASLGFRDRAEARGLATCLADIVDAPPRGEHRPRVVEALFNPHLLVQTRPPVPCSIGFARHDAIAIFTGPNSGGKTRIIQALALAQLLGQAGMFVPAKRAELVRAEGLFVSFIGEAHPDEREGRLGTELLRIRDVFERLRPGALVLFDELCSGTNPSEGEEIFELVTSLLAELEPQAFITTHFLDLAARLAAKTNDGAMVFLRADLDEHDEPTYQFVPGVARSSLAKKTAARLGVTRETLAALVERARAGR